jgi:serine/threonine-protein kinase RsbW
MREFVLKTRSAPVSGRTLVKTAMAILGESIADPEIIHELDLVLTEACSNVCRHAYEDGLGDLQVAICLQENEFVEIEVVDWGQGIDPVLLRCENPDPSAEGGRGLYIMATLSDVFAVRQDGVRNVVHIRKNIGKSAWKTCT